MAAQDTARRAKIIEDWAASDNLSLAQQLGIWRSLLILAKHYKLLRI